MKISTYTGIVRVQPDKFSHHYSSPVIWNNIYLYTSKINKR